MSHTRAALASIVIPAIALVSLAAALGFAALPRLGEIASAQSADPATLVHEYYDGMNRGDAVAAAAPFSDNADYTDVSNCQSGCKNHAEIASSIIMN